MQIETRINPLDFEADVAIGLSLPITDGNNMNFRSNYLTFDQIKTNLKNLLLTEPGERIMMPRYGCGLKHKLFEKDNNQNSTNIKTLIMNAVNTYMPFVTVDNITVGRDTQNEYAINVHVDFSVDVYNKKDTLFIQISE